MTTTQNIFLIGPMGAGKTSIGKLLATELKMTFYDSDQVIEERAGADILWIYDLEGEDGFRQREMKVIAELVKLKGIVLATGGSTVYVQENRATLSANGTIVYLKASLDDQVRRTSKSRKRPLVPEEDARRVMLKNLGDEYEPLYRELADITYSTCDKTTRAIVSDLVGLIEELK